MKKWIPVWLSVFGAILFEQLFYTHGAGMNVGLFYLFCLISVYVIQRDFPMRGLHVFAGLSVLSLSMAFSWHGNQFTFFVLMLLTFLWLGSLAVPGARFIQLLPEESLLSAMRSQFALMNRISGLKILKKSWLRWLMFLMVFVLLISVFIGLYSTGNVVFGNYASGFTDWLLSVLDNFSPAAILVTAFGFFICNWMLFHTGNQKNAALWNDKANVVQRKRGSRPAFTGLKQSLKLEYHSGLLLFTGLNLLLLLLNIADVYMVWFGFQWKGQLLKDFVHTGTWNLIVSIVLAVLIMVYYFRQNLNFINKPWLRRLAYIWIAQNLFLAISLLLRNWHYIANYGLAYRRIGVYFFLIGVLAMLFFLVLKIKRKESLVVFVHRNLLAFVCILVVSALPDWSMIITKWNFGNYKKSYVHTDFLAEMPDRCLPIFVQFRSRFDEIESHQKMLGFKYNPRVKDESLDVFVSTRISNFVATYPMKNWRETTIKDRQAYEYLGKQ